MLRGYSGYNTAWALHLLQALFPQGMAAPALVTVFFGANDAVLKGRSRCITLVSVQFRSESSPGSHTGSRAWGDALLSAVGSPRGSAPAAHTGFRA